MLSSELECYNFGREYFHLRGNVLDTYNLGWGISWDAKQFSKLSRGQNKHGYFISAPLQQNVYCTIILILSKKSLNIIRHYLRACSKKCFSK